MRCSLHSLCNFICKTISGINKNKEKRKQRKRCLIFWLLPVGKNYTSPQNGIAETAEGNLSMGKHVCLRQKLHKMLVVFRSLNEACQKLQETLKKITYYTWCHSSLEEPKQRISKQSAEGVWERAQGHPLLLSESCSVPGTKCIIEIIKIASGNWL